MKTKKINYIEGERIEKYAKPSLEQISNWKSMKARFKSFPRLPKYILNSRKVGQKTLSVELKYSIFRGFIDRVTNWEKDHYPSELAKEQKMNEIYLKRKQR